ncbi:MAG: hypothetical protein K0B10_09665 [Vicingaceae bacterium]|nr:hypothetical protein [Vicingaceae bacterium]
MSYKIYNPYTNIGNQFKEGLDYVIANIGSPAVYENLEKVMRDYFKTIFDFETNPPYYTPIIDNLVLSILPNTANSYQNSNLRNDSFYNQEQIAIINSIYDAIKVNDIEGIEAVLDDANQEIAQSGLSNVDQTPLFVAVEIGKISYLYWKSAVYEGSSWSEYLSDQVPVNVANIPFWVIASMEGALIGFAQVQQLDMGVANYQNFAGRSIATMSAMLAAVGLSSGKMFFKWIKKANSTKLTLNKEAIARFDGSGVDIENGGTQIAGTRLLCFASNARNCSAGSCGRNTQTANTGGVVIACVNF